MTGEIDDETLRSLGSSSNSVAGASQSSAKPAPRQPASIRPDANSRVTQSSPPPLSEQPSVAATSSGHQVSRRLIHYLRQAFTNQRRVRVNRRTIAEAQYQLMSRGYYRGRLDGSYGRQTAVGLRAFQSSAGLVPTGRFDMETLSALGLSNQISHYAASFSP